MPAMPDMQSPDTRNIAIDKVGVKDIRYPIVVMDKSKVHQHTVARINMYVDLPHHFKGTHMSRFIEILNQYHGEITIDNMERSCSEMKERLEATCAHHGAGISLFHREGGPRLPGPQADGVSVPHGRHPGEEQDFVLGSPFR